MTDKEYDQRLPPYLQPPRDLYDKDGRLKNLWEHKPPLGGSDYRRWKQAFNEQRIFQSLTDIPEDH